MDHCFDLRRVEQGVVDKAFVDSAKDTGFVLGGERGGEDSDVERCQARRLSGLLGNDFDLEPRALERMGVQVLGDVESRAGAQRSEQEFGRGHPLVIAAIIGRLIANDAMAAGFGLKLHIPEVSNRDFHVTQEDADGGKR